MGPERLSSPRPSLWPRGRGRKERSTELMFSAVCVQKDDSGNWRPDTMEIQRLRLQPDLSCWPQVLQTLLCSLRTSRSQAMFTEGVLGGSFLSSAISGTSSTLLAESKLSSGPQDPEHHSYPGVSRLPVNQCRCKREKMLLSCYLN